MRPENGLNRHHNRHHPHCETQPLKRLNDLIDEASFMRCVAPRIRALPSYSRMRASGTRREAWIDRTSTRTLMRCPRLTAAAYHLHTRTCSLYLVYVDEVKYQPPLQRFYWLCALAISEEDAAPVEAALSRIAITYFGSDELSKRAEFHASAIVSHKYPCKHLPIDVCVQLFKDLVDVIDAHPRIGRIQVRLNPAKMGRVDHHAVAFMYLIEKVDDLMKSRGSRALIIADHDKETAGANVRSLAAFRRLGTGFAYGRQIGRIVDTIHHTHSHESRLLQLADIYAYAVSLRVQSPRASHRVDIVNHIHALANFVWPTKYKHWPPDDAA